jgi:hypothetical protein
MRLSPLLFAAFIASPALAQAQAAPAADSMAGMDMSNMPGMAGMAPGTAPAPPVAAQAAQDMANMPGKAGMASTGVLGPYPMTRDASGTSWQPDASMHNGVHGKSGDWATMIHATFNTVFDHQGGPRGGEKVYLAGMVMAAARRDLPDGGTVNLRAMLSPDPPMGPRGYPLLLAAGETADGKTPLVDRQHPHDLFMELAASYARKVGAKDSLFVYAGLPGEPAFGPPAFMHRQSILDTPEAPITHHWMDSTHITFGVLTAGWVHANWKVEASRFKGREPDEHRYDIESPRLDSSAVRVSWNPTANWSLQVSRANLASPEALEPDQNQGRWSASALYTRPFGEHGIWATTAAWGRKRQTGGETTDAYALESTIKPNQAWTVFARAERLTTGELGGAALHGALETVSKASIGAIRDWRLSAHMKAGVGALASVNGIPSGLKAAYGNSPTGAMGFLRLVID